MRTTIKILIIFSCIILFILGVLFIIFSIYPMSNDAITGNIIYESKEMYKNYMPNINRNILYFLLSMIIVFILSLIVSKNIMTPIKRLKEEKNKMHDKMKNHELEKEDIEKKYHELNEKINKKQEEIEQLISLLMKREREIRDLKKEDKK